MRRSTHGSKHPIKEQEQSNNSFSSNFQLVVQWSFSGLVRTRRKSIFHGNFLVVEEVVVINGGSVDQVAAVLDRSAGWKFTPVSPPKVMMEELVIASWESRAVVAVAERCNWCVTVKAETVELVRSAH